MLHIQTATRDILGGRDDQKVEAILKKQPLGSLLCNRFNYPH